MIAVALAIVAAAAAGIATERRLGTSAHRLSRRLLTLMFWALMPFVIFFSIARLHLDAGVGLGIVLAYAALAVAALAAWAIGTHALRLQRTATGALMVTTIMANTGYFGAPLIGAALGTGAIGAAIAFDTLVSGPMFYVVAIAVGAGFGVRRARGGGVRRFLRNPPLIAVVAGALAPDALAPEALVHAAHVLVYGLLVVGFFAVGITLAAEAGGGALRIPPPLTRPVAAGIGLRMLLAPALYLGVASAVGGIPHAYLIQAAMPAGVNSLVIAHLYGLDLRLTASTLAWTTLLAVVATLVVAAL